jgi:hypothetical protein
VGSRPDPATRTAVRAVRALALLAIGVVVIVFVAAGQDDEDEPVGAAPSVGEPAATPSEAAPRVADLVAERAGALAAADGRHDAVVSLTSYRSPDGVVRIAERAGVDVVAVLVAAPGGPPALVDDSLADWVDARRAEAQQQRDALAEIVPTVGPEDPFLAVYLEDIAALDEELASLGTSSELVYGFTTTASAEVLRELALRADVRLVDVDGVLPLGLRPEEVDLVGAPATRPPRT